jgi:hypothetical protein
VSVGFAADYPDLCSITVSSPETRVALQVLESDASPFGGNSTIAGNALSFNELDPSVTDWNASADTAGIIRLTAGG